MLDTKNKFTHLEEPVRPLHVQVVVGLVAQILRAHADLGGKYEIRHDPITLKCFLNAFFTLIGLALLGWKSHLVFGSRTPPLRPGRVPRTG